ncbi:hypothetical protein BSNK01_05910 [Bacillaceae bacterium]
MGNEAFRAASRDCEIGTGSGERRLKAKKTGNEPEVVFRGMEGWE